jgi:hypothetical protein
MVDALNIAGIAQQNCPRFQDNKSPVKKATFEPIIARLDGGISRGRRGVIPAPQEHGRFPRFDGQQV